MKEIIKRYYELNAERETEGLREWEERMRLHGFICSKLFRDLRKIAERDVCRFCGGSILEGDGTYVHDACLEGQISYRDGVEKNSEAFVYYLYRFECLVYVGITNKPRSRFKAHLMEKDVWQMEVIFGGSSEKVAAMEKKLIHKYYPPLNKKLHDATGRPLLAKDLNAKVIGYDDVRLLVREMTSEHESMLRSLWQKVKKMEIQMNAYHDRMNFLEAVVFQPVEEDCW